MKINLLSGNSLGTTGSIIFIVVGILCLFLGVGIIFLYRWNSKRREKEKRSDFKATNRRFSHQIFSFWTNYVYFFMIVVAFLIALIFIPIGIGYFI